MNKSIIDLELGKKLINGDDARAKDMLTMLIDMLPAHEKEIKEAHDNKDHDTLVSEVHKLRGGVCYCGTPQLQETTSALEIALKKAELDTEKLYQALLTSIEAFKAHYQQL